MPPADGAPTVPAVIGSSPPDAATGVGRTGAFEVFFDTVLKPATINRATVRVESGETRHTVSVRFDPVDRRIVAAAFGGGALEPEVTYRLVVEEVRDLDDARLPEPYVAVFRTGVDEGTPFVPETAAYADVAPILGRSCARAACHGADAPAVGLDLSTPEGIRTTAIGIRSRELPSGTLSEGGRSALALAGMPIIDVVAGAGRPSWSYLLYKALGDPHVVGEVMPPPGDDPLSQDELRTLSAWILAGAPTD